MTQVFTAQATDGKSDEFVLKSGKANLYVSGTFGGGSVTVEVKDPGGNWGALASGPSVSANEAHPIDMKAPAKCRLDLAGATSPSLNAWVEEDTPYVRQTVETR